MSAIVYHRKLLSSNPIIELKSLINMLYRYMLALTRQYYYSSFL